MRSPLANFCGAYAKKAVAGRRPESDNLPANEAARQRAPLPPSPHQPKEESSIMKKVLPVLVLGILGSALTAFAADGAAIWSDNCAKCHGAEGQGDTNIGRKLRISNLSEAAVQAQFTDDQALSAVKDGVKDKDSKVRMKAVEGLSDDDIKAVVQHLRTLKK
jgi:cytochrome c553